MHLNFGLYSTVSFTLSQNFNLLRATRKGESGYFIKIKLKIYILNYVEEEDPA
jgi:hypothetical protein